VSIRKGEGIYGVVRVPLCSIVYAPILYKT